jgi:hypothetical protein
VREIVVRPISTLPGTWLLTLFAMIPILAAGVASAAPGYPVEDSGEIQFAVSYEPASNVLTLSASTAEAPDAGTVGRDGATNDVSVLAVGPNGQVNHGQIVKQVHGLAEGRQLGCIARNVGQSDLGKGDQQVRPHEQPTSSVTTEPIDPSVLEADCTDSAVSGGSASTATSGNPADDRDKPKGKSADAPGKNK